VSWPFTELSEWTVWTTLVVLTLYDLLAVLAPCGPLKFIMDAEAASKADPDPESGDSSPLPGLMYKGKHFSLGLGDLIFYAALMGRAARVGIIQWIAATIGVIMGVIGTVAWAVSQKSFRAIPALPLSVACGLVLYAASATVMNTYADAMGMASIGLWDSNKGTT